jgi:hypothetical protein
MAQKMVDNTFGAMFDSAGSAGGNAGGGGMPFSLGGNAKNEDRYQFTVVSMMDIESTAKSGRVSKAVMQMHFNPDAPYVGTNMISMDGKKVEGTAFVVMDAKNQSMVMLMAKDKDKFSIAYEWKDAVKFAEAAASPNQQVNWDTVTTWKSWQKLGSRTIAGLAATGYRGTSAEGTT